MSLLVGIHTGVGAMVSLGLQCTAQEDLCNGAAEFHKDWRIHSAPHSDSSARTLCGKQQGLNKNCGVNAMPTFPLYPGYVFNACAHVHTCVHVCGT